MSRTAGGDKLFGPAEKEVFLTIMRRLERFSGVRVLTYAVMANHFHVLVRVPDRARFLEQFHGDDGEAKLLQHLGLLYSDEFLAALRAELADLRKNEMAEEAEELLERFRLRLCNLPLFVKELKERFSKWFNKMHDRKGTLWMERFKSVLVEDGEALRTMACYIDLNAVRGGLVKDSKDYRWCGYAEAVAGSELAQAGLCDLMGRELEFWSNPFADALDGPENAGSLYRSWLFEHGVETESRRGVSKEDREVVRKRAGGLTRGELLACKVRYFSDGVAIGSKTFVDRVFAESRSNFSSGRESGARKIKEATGLGLFSLRQLQVWAVE